MAISWVLLILVLDAPSSGGVRHSGPPDVVAQVDYEAWKSLARSGMSGSRYYSFAGLRHGEPVFQFDGVGAARTAQDWLGRDRHRTGFAFFDTVDAVAPPVGRLTPRVSLSCRTADRRRTWLLRASRTSTPRM